MSLWSSSFDRRRETFFFFSLCGLNIRFQHVFSFCLCFFFWWDFFSSLSKVYYIYFNTLLFSRTCIRSFFCVWIYLLFAGGYRLDIVTCCVQRCVKRRCNDFKKKKKDGGLHDDGTASLRRYDNLIAKKQNLFIFQQDNIKVEVSQIRLKQIWCW